MEIVRARKMRIYPSRKQQIQINNTLNHCRYIYNHMLERNNKVYKRRGEHLSYYDMQNLLPKMKRYLPFLKEADSQALQQACKCLNMAFSKFFKKQANYPKFHSKRGRQSYTTTQIATMSVSPYNIKLPIVGNIRTSDKREFADKICYATVSKEPNGKYYVSVTYKTEIAVSTVAVNEDNVIGLDYKSNGLYCDSDGNVAKMPHYYQKSQRERTKLQRQLSKKRGSLKGEEKSNNYLKLLRRLNKKNFHIINQRKDFLHKLSTEIANRVDGVCVEDLDMTEVARLNFGSKGSSLGKRTYDNGYGMFRKMLEYKLSDRGKAFVKVARDYPSSQICSKCGEIHPEMSDLSIKKLRCSCGVELDRDYNAAINIRREGLRLLEIAA